MDPQPASHPSRKGIIELSLRVHETLTGTLILAAVFDWD
jgi:hypothetical protein